VARASDTDRPTDADLLDLAHKRGAAEALIIDPARIVVSEAVALACRDGCPEYGQWRTCPPFSPPPEETRRFLADYDRAVLIRFRVPLTAGPKTPIMKGPQRALAELERDLVGRGAPRARALGMGRCWQCDTCRLEPDQCLHPEIARPSLEACGIDVITTADRLGLGLSVWAEGDDEVDLAGMVLVN
jgi:predicted metal-binding protein